MYFARIGAYEGGRSPARATHAMTEPALRWRGFLTSSCAGLLLVFSRLDNSCMQSNPIQNAQFLTIGLSEGRSFAYDGSRSRATNQHHKSTRVQPPETGRRSDEEFGDRSPGARRAIKATIKSQTLPQCDVGKADSDSPTLATSRGPSDHQGQRKAKASPKQAIKPTSMPKAPPTPPRATAPLAENETVSSSSQGQCQEFPIWPI